MHDVWKTRGRPHHSTFSVFSSVCRSLWATWYPPQTRRAPSPLVSFRNPPKAELNACGRWGTLLSPVPPPWVKMVEDFNPPRLLSDPPIRRRDPAMVSVDEDLGSSVGEEVVGSDSLIVFDIISWEMGRIVAESVWISKGRRNCLFWATVLQGTSRAQGSFEKILRLQSFNKDRPNYILFICMPLKLVLLR